MPGTIDTIVDLSDLPCSIIIIGVGQADFSSMSALDGDGQRLRSSGGKVAKRDIVQFVSFTECMKLGNLAEQVLKEVPTQFCAYMETISYKPVAKAHDFVAL